jgi:hypothetical protein
MNTAVAYADHTIAKNMPSHTPFMTNTVKRVLADIHELTPHVTSRAAEIEAGRRIPPDLVDSLKSIGVFRMFVPQSHGGLELAECLKFDAVWR